MEAEIILGIESSCDDTAIAIVTREGKVLASSIAGQEDVHRNFGGVYPEFASRAHVQSILPAIQDTLAKSGLNPEDIGAIGVTRGPGLIGSLLIGLTTASALGLAWDKPVIGINHLRGHLRSADLEEKRLEYPALMLLVSGGHTLLAYLPNKTDIKILGTTRDDSVGEAYDKVARMMNLGFPGGPEIDRLAMAGEAVIKFPRPLLHEGLEFSFSGLKSSVRRYIDSGEPYEPQNLAASFTAACMDVLVAKSRKAIKAHDVKSFAIVGGVSASKQLRGVMAELCEELNVKLCVPPLTWSTDNAAMIALATFDYIDAGVMPEPKGTARLSAEDY